MTYREYANKLPKDVKNKYEIFRNAERILSDTINKESYENFNSCYTDWQLAQNDYNGFISLLLK
jgi:hypothetical protein